VTSAILSSDARCGLCATFDVRVAVGCVVIEFVIELHKHPAYCLEATVVYTHGQAASACSNL
jgi:hypothetical protein